MTRKASKRSSDENIEQNLANYLKRKSLLHQQILLQKPPLAQDRPRFWTTISNQLWNLVTKTFKKGLFKHLHLFFRILLITFKIRSFFVDHLAIDTSR